VNNGIIDIANLIGVKILYMKNILTKRVIIIFSVLLTVVVTALIVALVTGNSRLPQLSEPDGIFYERIDEDGNVVYAITNQEIFEELKTNDGIDQLLYLIDNYLLQAYVGQVTATQIEDKIKLLKYGTSDDDEIAEIDADVKESYENAFDQSMTLAGYSGNEDEYATLVIAKEIYTRYAADIAGSVTEEAVASEFMKQYFEDIKAIRIRFTSSIDATAVMQRFNLVTYDAKTIREYLGFAFTSETLLDAAEKIVEAYVTVDTFYTDATGNILNLSDVIVYTLGSNSIYTNSTGAEFTKDISGNLVDIDLDIVVKVEHIFETKTEATAYKTTNTHYYTVSKTDAFDTDEDAVVKDGDVVLYTIDSDGKIYNPALEDVTATTDLIVNKVYKSIKTMGTVTINNSKELTDAEILTAYIKMYNYVYNTQRADLLETATAEDLIASVDENLTFNFESINKTSSSLATYMFSTLDLTDSTLEAYSPSAKSYTVSSNSYYFMVYKLTQPAKVDIYEIMLDAIENNIKIPAAAIDDITLPTAGWYKSTITWTSANAALLSAKGVVTKPETSDTDVVLTYKITLDGSTRSGTKTVKVLKTGTTAVVDTTTGTQTSVKSIVSDDVTYQALYDKLLDAYVANTDTDNVSTMMAELRATFNFIINDKFLGVDYQTIDADFEYNTKGDDLIVASVSGFPGFEGAAQTDTIEEVSADELFTYAIGKSAALYTLYAAQFKEILYSDYYVAIFGEQRDVTKNTSDKMDEIYDSIRSQKMSYLSYKSLYEQYGISFNYDDFSSYSRYQYGTKTELDLLKYLVKGVLQPFLIDEAITDEALIELLLSTVEENYDNYFSLNVTHLIIHLDFDEDGSPDDYNDYIASLTELELDAFETLKAGLEADVLEYLDDSDNTFASLITAFTAATRDNETWGAYKQAGLWLMTEDLNIADEEDETITHSLQYSGTYGVKDAYVDEYTTALIALYQEYQLEQNANLEQLYSNLVTTQFGIHLLLVTKGDDFDRFSAEYTGDAAEYSLGAVNATGKPTLAQLKLYAQYYMYNLVYDLTDTEIEEKYNITIPKLPNTVIEALEFYFEDLLAEMYVVGTLNIQLSSRLASGEFYSSTYTDYTETQLFAQMAEIRQTYYDALFAKYQD